MSTFGPAYDPALDRERVAAQMDRIRGYMLLASGAGKWKTLREIEELTGYPQASISAQLRHLRKPAFGGYVVRKRRRDQKGIWEYIVFAPPVQTHFEFKP